MFNALSSHPLNTSSKSPIAIKDSDVFAIYKLVLVVGRYLKATLEAASFWTDVFGTY